LAAINGHAETVKVLLTEGADPKTAYKKGKTSYINSMIGNAVDLHNKDHWKSVMHMTLK
jgi:ankyrin repeat protein